jgi:hypothetical protein
MLTETAAITVSAGAQAHIDAALHRIAAYLDTSRHCAGYLLTRSPAGAGVYILSATWDSPEWRRLAWRYFSDMLAGTDLAYSVALSSMVAQKVTVVARG